MNGQWIVSGHAKLTLGNITNGCGNNFSPVVEGHGEVITGSITSGCASIYSPDVSGHGIVKSGNITTGGGSTYSPVVSQHGKITVERNTTGAGLMNLCTVLNGVTNNSLLAVRGSDACSYTKNATNDATMTIVGLILL